MHRCIALKAVRWIAPLVLFVSCMAGAADPAKILRIALPRAETGFDPAMASVRLVVISSVYPVA